MKHGIQSVRLFPDVLRDSDINRTQTVNFGPNGTLWIPRNGDPERSFFVLPPPQNTGDKWSLTDKILLPPDGDDMAMIHSALWEHKTNRIFTIKSSADVNEWQSTIYSVADEKTLFYNSSDRIEPFTYGITLTNYGLLTVTNFRSTKKHGIYLYQNLAVPDVFGNGITSLSDGSVLVSVYGQTCPGPFNGVPGMLLYISKKQLGE